MSQRNRGYSYQGSGGERTNAPHSNRSPDPDILSVWPGYLQNGYFDGNNNIRVELVGRERIVPLVKRMSEGYPALTTHQVRRFFGHCRVIESKLRSSKDDDEAAITWAQNQAEFIKMDSIASAAFPTNKDNRKIPRLFYDFIRLNVQAVKTHQDFLKGFMPHFESIVGFGTLYLPEGEKR